MKFLWIWGPTLFLAIVIAIGVVVLALRLRAYLIAQRLERAAREATVPSDLTRAADRVYLEETLAILRQLNAETKDDFYAQAEYSDVLRKTDVLLAEIEHRQPGEITESALRRQAQRHQQEGSTG